MAAAAAAPEVAAKVPARTLPDRQGLIVRRCLVRPLIAIAAGSRPASGKAVERDLRVSFVLGDALALDHLVPSPEAPFDTVLDCGLFHVFSDEDRLRHVTSLHAATRRGSRLHLLCFSDRVPGNVGPRRISAAEIIATFDADWDVEEIRRDTLEVTTQAPVPAWLATLTRR